MELAFFYDYLDAFMASVAEFKAMKHMRNPLLVYLHVD